MLLAGDSLSERSDRRTGSGVGQYVGFAHGVGRHSATAEATPFTRWCMYGEASMGLNW